MPHFIVEYTANLGEEADIRGLLEKVHRVLIKRRDSFPIGGIRSRAIRLDEYYVADGAEDDAFVHATLKIGAGRPEQVKKEVGAELFAVMKDHFAPLFGETAGAALVAHPDVRLISFTGETTTGMEIIRNSAATLKKTSMELGGKSPLIVFADADLDRALDAAVWGVFSLNGERCTANSRLLLEQSIYDEFVARLKERVDRIVIGDPMNPATELGPLIHRDHWERVNRYIEIAKQEGADVYAPGVPKGLERGNFVPPTLLLNCRNDMKVAQEEIFGPVMAVMSFTSESEEEAIRLANDVKYGLAAYVWTNDMKRGHRVAQAIESGMAWVNSPNVRDLRIPFGGTKYSGIGREGGHYSFDFYTEVQVVHVAVGDPPIPAFGKGEKQTALSAEQA
nr:aldehyde dehydrogenase family protein [Geobacillus thermoleovorans]